MLCLPFMPVLLVHVLLATAAALLTLLTCASGTGDWKDDWIRAWERHAENGAAWSICQPGQQRCALPKYVAARQRNTTAQRIPRVIWQTWSSMDVGARQHAAMTAWIHDNPEYEYYMFDDQDAMDFMCSFHATGAALVYQLLAPGAAKADLWRLAIMQRYGGVYMDVDTRPQAPLRSFIWPDTSMVSGWGAESDFHQWGLIYAPGHPIIETALRSTVQRVLDVYQQRKAAPTPWLTGPGALMDGARQAMNNDPACREWLAQPLLDNRVVARIFTSDMFGGHVLFKSEGVAQEMVQGSARKPYQQLDNHWSTLFDPVAVEVHGTSSMRVGQCNVTDQATVQAWAPLLRFLVKQAQPVRDDALVFWLDLGVVLATALLICLLIARWCHRRRRDPRSA